MKDKPKWYHCKIWKILIRSGASENSKWGMARALELKWCIGSSGKKHLCSWNDKDHAIAEKYDKLVRAGKMSYTSYKEPASILDDELILREYKTTYDEYGNPTHHMERINNAKI